MIKIKSLKELKYITKLTKEIKKIVQDMKEERCRNPEKDSN
jgi:hypothetical protein